MMEWEKQLSALINKGYGQQAALHIKQLERDLENHESLKLYKGILALNQGLAAKDHNMVLQAQQLLDGVARRAPLKTYRINAARALGQYYQDLPDLVRAVEYFKILLAENQADPIGLRGVATGLMAQQAWLEAIAFWQKLLIAADPLKFPFNDDHPWVRLSFCYLKENKYDDAFYYAQLAINHAAKQLKRQQKPEFVIAYNISGMVLQHRQEYRKAFLNFIRAWRNSKADHSIYVNVLLSLKKLQKYRLLRILFADQLLTLPFDSKIIVEFWGVLAKNGQALPVAQSVLLKLKMKDQQYIASNILVAIRQMLVHDAKIIALDALSFLDAPANSSPQNFIMRFQTLTENDKFDEAKSLVKAGPKDLKSFLKLNNYNIFLKSYYKVACAGTDHQLKDQIFWESEMLAPNNLYMIHQRATDMMARMKFGAGLALYEAMLRLQKSAETYSGVSFGLGAVNLFCAAIRESAPAFKITPESVNLNRNYAINLLEIGNYKHGFAVFGERWKLKNDGNSDAVSIRAMLPFPVLSDIDAAKGKAIIVYCEQGLGDAIHFIRFLPLLRQYGASKISLLMKGYDALVSLFKLRDPDLFDIIEMPANTTSLTLHPHDFQCSLMDFPNLFRSDLSNLPPPLSYKLPAPKLSEWAKRINDLGSSRTKIGFVYEGGVINPANKRRSLGLENFKIILEKHAPDADFFCLQKEITPRDYKALKEIQQVHLLDDKINDFQDTACIIDQMDLVISVDTAVAHLAASMGKPCWVMITKRNDWRWGVNKRRSPWYPSIMLYRQPVFNDWQGMLFLLDADLRDFIYRNGKLTA
ncbi:MAG: glycosyltransferase family 9 protein [Alphaproteobacteria bacterium]